MAVIVTGQMRLLIIGLLILAGPTIYGQKRQGYIDYEKVAVIFPQYADGQNVVEKRTKQLNDSLHIMADKFEPLYRGCYPSNMTTDSTFRKEMQDKLNRLQTEIERFQEYAKKEINDIQQKVDTNLKTEVIKELKQFSADNNVICALDKKSVLYCNDCKDFTDDFIHYYKERRK